MSASRASRDSNLLWGSAPRGTPRSRAISAPPQLGLLVATATTSKSRSRRFRRLLPRPDTSTPSLTCRAPPQAISREMAGSGAAKRAISREIGRSREEHARGARLLDDLADDRQVAGGRGVHYQNHPDPEVEGALHLFVGDPAARLDEPEDRRHLPP